MKWSCAVRRRCWQPTKGHERSTKRGLAVPSISDFQIIRPISEGAFGRVYLARKIVTGDFFTVKVQRKDKALGHGANAKRVMSERDILVHADHPFIVKLFFCFQSKHNLYLVMEYLAGGDLHALLKSVGRFEEQLASIYLGAEIVLGLEYLHETLRIVTATADSRIEHARIGGARARPPRPVLSRQPSHAQSSHARPNRARTHSIRPIGRFIATSSQRTY